MTIIKHFTTSVALPSILDSNEIWLENERTKKMVQDPNIMSSFDPWFAEQIRFRYKIVKRQIKKMGAYVWFTEEDRCHCIEEQGQPPRIPLVFNSEDINVIKWTDMVRRKSWDKKFIKEWIKLESVTTKDDYTKWWVAIKSVSLERLNDHENQINYLKTHINK
tara:strand:- start:319 stop:807 length:489 start_codon:yes stop_codon:yes gene_type:complete